MKRRGVAQSSGAGGPSRLKLFLIGEEREANVMTITAENYFVLFFCVSHCPVDLYSFFFMYRIIDLFFLISYDFAFIKCLISVISLIHLFVL